MADMIHFAYEPGNRLHRQRAEAARVQAEIERERREASEGVPSQVRDKEAA